MLARYPAAINLPVNLYDYVFDVPPGDDARDQTIQEANTRSVAGHRRKRRLSAHLSYAYVGTTCIVRKLRNLISREFR